MPWRRVGKGNKEYGGYGDLIEEDDLMRFMEDLGDVALREMSMRGAYRALRESYKDSQAIGIGYVCAFEGDNGICAVFAFIIGEDKSYEVIENGSWLSDSAYGTIHRIASDGKAHGILKQAVEFCLEKIPHLRIDTHADNLIMQRQIYLLNRHSSYHHKLFQQV